MAHHMVDEPWDWAQQSAFIFWIRHPRKVVQSFAKVIPNVTADDIGLDQEWQQWQKVARLPGKKIIVDSDEMLADPAHTLPRICEALELAMASGNVELAGGCKSVRRPLGKALVQQCTPEYKFWPTKGSCRSPW